MDIPMMRLSFYAPAGTITRDNLDFELASRGISLFGSRFARNEEEDDEL